MIVLPPVPAIEIFDSRDNKDYVWVIIDKCLVPILKTDLKKNPDKVVDYVLKECLDEKE